MNIKQIYIGILHFLILFTVAIGLLGCDGLGSSAVLNSCNLADCYTGPVVEIQNSLIDYPTDSSMKVLKIENSGVVSLINGRIFNSSYNGSKIYFSGQTSAGYQIYYYNFNSKTTNPVGPYFRSVFEHTYEVLNNILYFVAKENDGIDQLWSLDMTSDVLTKLTNYGSGSTRTFSNLFAKNDKVYFFLGVYSTTTNKEIWSFNPLNSQIIKVTDFASSPGDSRYLSVFYSDENQLLLKSTANNQVLVKYDKINETYTSHNMTVPGTSFRISESLGKVANLVYLSASNNQSGAEIFRLDLLTNVISLALESQAGNKSFYVQESIYFENKFYMNGIIEDDETVGGELYVYDPQLNSITLVRDLYPGTYRYLNNDYSNDSSPTYFSILNNKLFFKARDGIFNTSIYQLENNEITKVDINTSISQENLFVNSEFIIFTHGSLDTLGLYRINTNSTELNITRSSSFLSKTYIRHFLNFSSSLYYFVARNADFGEALWSYNSLTNQSNLVAQGNLGEQGDSIDSIIKFNQYLYYFSDASTNGKELWRFNTVNKEQLRLTNLNPGDSYRFSLRNLLVFNGQIYFVAMGENRDRFYRLDPETNQLVMISNEYKSFSEFVVTTNFLFFSAENSTYGRELFKFSPSTNLIEITVDQSPGTASTYIIDATLYNNLIIMGCTCTTNNRELWSYNINTNTYSLLYDVYPGSQSSNPENLVINQNNLYFSATTSSDNLEILTLNLQTNLLTSIVEVASDNSYDYDLDDFKVYQGFLYYTFEDSDLNISKIQKINLTNLAVTDVKNLIADENNSNPYLYGIFEDKIFFSQNANLYMIGVD